MVSEASKVNLEISENLELQGLQDLLGYLVRSVRLVVMEHQECLANED